MSVPEIETAYDHHIEQLLALVAGESVNDLPSPLREKYTLAYNLLSDIFLSAEVAGVDIEHVQDILASDVAEMLQTVIDNAAENAEYERIERARSVVPMCQHRRYGDTRHCGEMTCRNYVGKHRR